MQRPLQRSKMAAWIGNRGRMARDISNGPLRLSTQGTSIL
jgi:hypothetical protein